MILDAMGHRRFRVYERRREDVKLPRYAWFFLVDDENENVFASADALKVDQFSRLVYLSSGELVVYDGEVRQIRNRSFISLRALGEGKPAFEEARVKILESFRKCQEIVDHFD